MDPCCMDRRAYDFLDFVDDLVKLEFEALLQRYLRGRASRFCRIESGLAMTPCGSVAVRHVCSTSVLHLVKRVLSASDNGHDSIECPV